MSKFLFLKSMDILTTIPQYHVLLEAFLILWIVWLVVKRSYNSRQSPQLTDAEVERKLADWQPEPLVPVIRKDHPALKPRLITTKVGKKITVDGKECLNLGTHNYLGLVDNEQIQENAVAAVQKYGVGSCGPRGFYGTVDVHLDLEERLAKFMGAEEAVVYSYGFSTVSSAIAAYCKRKDIVFVDEKVNFAVQKGLDASRSNIKYFRHNDVQDLERLLKEQGGLDKRNSKKAAKTRRFLIVEGLYMNTGDICPLPELIPLCRKYKLRIFIDESVSFGTLGQHGRGVTEHYGVSRHEVDMIIGSLEWAVASIGGFCVGSSFVIDHQRLSGLGYCFSASSPPLLTAAAITSLDLMESNTDMFKTLRQNCSMIDRGLRKLDCFQLVSSVESPVKHLYLKDKLECSEEQTLLTNISDKCIEKGLAVISPAYLEAERELPRPSLRICVSVALNEDDIRFALQTLEECTKEILSQ